MFDALPVAEVHVPEHLHVPVVEVVVVLVRCVAHVHEQVLHNTSALLWPRMSLFDAAELDTAELSVNSKSESKSD